MPGGRPRKLTSAEQAEVLKAFEDYIARTPDPIMVGFCVWDPVALKYDVTDDNLQDWQEFSRLRKRSTMKQEAYLAVGMSQGKVPPVAAIFRLKQPVHGYTDKQQTDHTTNGKDLPTPILGGVSVKEDKDG